MNKKIFCLICLFLFVFVVSCDREKHRAKKSVIPGEEKFVQEDIPAYGDRIVTDLSGDIYNLNFINYKSSNELEIIYLIADSLISYDNNLNFVPRLATKWEINKNHTEVVFHLRKGVRFTDGVELTAKDVAYTYNCVFDPKNKLRDVAQTMTDLKKAEIIDDYTVKFVFSAPQAFILDYFVDFFIIPEHVYNTDKYSFQDNPANKKPVGTGPFKLVKWIKGKEIVLEANDSYFLGRPYLDKIIYLKGGSLDIAFERLKKGEFDLLPVSITTWKFKTEAPEIKNNFVKYKYFLLAFYYIAWNTHRKPLNDRNVRLALSCLADLEKFNKLAFFGLYKVAVSPLHPQSKYFNKNLSPFPFDVERARKLLIMAGYTDKDGDGFLQDENGNELTVRLLVESGVALFDRIAVYLQENFKKAGIKLIIDQEERSVYEKKIVSLDYDGVLTGWMIYPSPSYLFSMFAESKGIYSMNINNYVNPEIEKLLDKLNHSFDEEDRLNICFRIQDILYKEQPYLFLYYPSALVIASNRYRNLKPSPLGMFKWYPGIIKVYVPKRLQKKY